MNLTYNRATILQGNRRRQENEEQPVTFAEYDGAVEPLISDNLDTKYSRKAGPMGAFAMSLMNDPVALEQQNRWNELFGQSNQGAEFNATKEAQMAQVTQDQAIIDEYGNQNDRTTEEERQAMDGAA